MALRNHLIHRCTIQRAEELRGEAGEIIKVWADHLKLAPCRLIISTEREAEPSDGFLVKSLYTLVIMSEQDVTTRDRVYEVIVDETVSLGPFNIVEVLPRRGKCQRFKSLTLEKIK